MKSEDHKKLALLGMTSQGEWPCKDINSAISGVHSDHHNHLFFRILK